METQTFIIEADTTEEDLHKQYRKLTTAAHPDTGGSEAEFKELNREYEFYKKNLDIIKEFDAMFLNGKDTFLKFTGFITNILTSNPSYGLVADMINIYLTKKIMDYNPGKLRKRFIDYLHTK